MSDPAALLKKHNTDPVEVFRQRMMDRRAGRVGPPPKLPKLEKPKITGKTILVIGDSHADPDVPNHRYDWLGRFIVDLQPDIVVDIGDWGDFASLNRFDLPGSKAFEGRRYWLDIEVYIDAQERVRAQLDDYNRGRRKKYKPHLVRVLGNHEHRIVRVVEESPRFEEFLGLHNLESAEFGWEEHPYREVVELEGICFSHSFPSGVMGRPIGGENPAAMLLKKQFHSAVAGHSHLLDYCERNDAVGKKVQTLFAGCYFGHQLEWAGPVINQMYARGLVVLRNVVNGTFDFEWIGIDRIQARYS